MSTLYMIMEYGGLTLALICLVIAVILFIRWDIPKVIGDLTGQTQRRAIAKIQKERNRDMLSRDDELQSEPNSGRIKARVSDKPLTGVLNSEEKTASLHAAATDEDVTDVLTARASGDLSGRNLAGDGEEVTDVLTATGLEMRTTVLGGSDASGESATTVLGTGNNREIITLPDEQITESGTIIQVLELIVVHTKDVVA
ncbi:MAG: hypothetical protein IJ079_09810 [Lachnospiraceae bacterium]|nr:hypothetical protein [Lachnospiraceae bacterium]